MDFNKKVILTTITTKPTYLQLGLYSLKVYAQKYGGLPPRFPIEIKVIKPKKYIFYQEDYWPYLDKKALLTHAKRLSKKNVGIIGFSCFNWNIELILKICQIIKKTRPEIIIVLGGPEVSVDADKILRQEEYIDIIIRDEGEATFTDLLQSLYYKKIKLKNIKGLTFRYKNKVVENPSREPLDLTKIPSPFLNNIIKPSNKEIMTIETSRGCPFKCAYCGYSMHGKGILRFFPINKVNRELKFLLNKNVKMLWINDDNFNINPQRAKNILTHIKKYRKSTHITTFLNASMWTIGVDLIKLLKKNNIQSIVGVQSINEKPLKIINRNNNLINTENNLKMFDKYKLSYVLQFIAGLPGDSYVGIKKSIDWASQFNAQEIQLFLLRIIKGTKLYYNAKTLGLKTIKKHSQFHTYIKETSQINKKDMIKLKKLINSLELLYNMGLLKKTSQFLIKNQAIKLSKIIEKWGEIIKLISNNNNYLKEAQNFFINRIIVKYQIKVPQKKIRQLLIQDMIFFRKNYLQSIYFSLFQVRENAYMV